MGLDMMLFRKQESGAEEVGYWRKANAVHQWFVNNVQGGEDNCQPSEVSHQQLQQLLEICQKLMTDVRVSEGLIVNGRQLTNNGWEDILVPGFVVDNPELCAELLPTTEGFFFGSTDYDEYYMQDVKDTIEILEKALSYPEAEYFYQASW